jgi:hypothetical protein
MQMTRYARSTLKKNRTTVFVSAAMILTALTCSFVSQSNASPDSTAPRVAAPKTLQNSAATHDASHTLTYSAEAEGAKSRTVNRLASSSDKIAKLKSQAKKIIDCEGLVKEKKRAEVLLNQPADYYSDGHQRAVDEGLAISSRNLQDLKDAGACEGIDAESSKGTVYPLLLEAANLGDADSASCYVDSRFDLTDAQLSPGELDVYRENAMRFIRDGLDRGDWRFVELMWIAAEHGGVNHRGRDSHSWFRRLIPSDPKEAYEYLKLLRFGATGDFSTTLDQELTATATKFSPEDLERMDTWAREQFSRYFSVSPTFDALPQTCTM